MSNSSVKELRLHLEDENATLALGQRLAQAIALQGKGINLLLEGNLGAGKTTLVRGLVTALPGGDEARVSSPSFNIMNLYPTTPETAHFDLYRLEYQEPDESLLEFLNDDETLVVVEWVQFLDKEFWPEDSIHFVWDHCDNGRDLRLIIAGDDALSVYEAAFPQSETD